LTPVSSLIHHFASEI